MSDEIFQQMSLFDFVYDKKTIKKPIRLIEFFAGIGSQFKALKQLTENVESYKICEWAFNSYCSYNAIHTKDFTDYSEGKTKKELIEKVKGTSTNYNEPLTEKQLNLKSIEWLRKAYNNIIATHNLVNIMEVKGDDLEITDTDKYEYVLTYSFPCQDLSLAGKRKGMSVSQAEGGTRSGLLWEVERILNELSLSLSLPQVLIMENVPQVVCPDFSKWQLKLEKLGYKNYVEILNSKNYGIPQNRKRCFMVSVLGDYSYQFPFKIKLKYRLKDMLESEVDNKYYLSEKMVQYITSDNDKWTGNNDKKIINKSIASTINTGEGSRRCDASNYICDELPEQYDLTVCDFRYDEGVRTRVDPHLCPTIATKSSGCSGMPLILTKKSLIKVGNYGNGHHAKDIFDADGLAPTITTGNHGLGQTIAIKNATKKGYIEAEDGDGIDISTRMEYHRGTVQKGISQTLTTMGGDNVGVLQNLRIRKLTPKECCRLMGFEDKDYQAIRDIGMSDNAIYHMCGDSIVVPTLISIFSMLMPEDNHKEIVDKYVESIVEK